MDFGEQLIADIYGVLRDPSTGKRLKDEAWVSFGARVAKHGLDAFAPPEKGPRAPRPPKTLYASEIGEPCLRKLWYKVHRPHLAEPLLGHTHLKFAYGDIVEELVLQGARAAGYAVTREQELVSTTTKGGWEIRGRVDAVIADQWVVDVKSVSPYSFDKYRKEGLTDTTDSFGYRTQLAFYRDGMGLPASGFILGNKTSGRLAWPTMQLGGSLDFRFDLIDEELADPVVPPTRAFADEDAGQGNRKLGTNCSYCAFKQACWPGLRAAAYARGPVFLTEAVKWPRVLEIPLSVAVEEMPG